MTSRAIDPRLKRIEISHFKQFEVLDLSLEPFNLLVGPNNSGKSTFLQACALFDFCYRSTLEKQNGSLRFVSRTFGPEEFTVVPAAEPLDLWLDRRVRSKKKPIPLRVRGEFRSGESFSFEITLSFNRFGVQPDPANPLPIPGDGFRIVFVPGYSGFWPREERRTPAVVRELRSQGQNGAVIRNLLLDLKSDATQWSSFQVVLESIFPEIVLREPEFDEQVDRYIRASYGARDLQGRSRREPAVRFDLFSAGAGFHQFVQIFGGIFSEKATTVLLDEPDAHLFSRLQSRLLEVLRRLVREGRQVIAATHSPELIAAANPADIISFANGRPRRLAVRAEIAGTARSLGALENIGLLLIDAYQAVIVVEDRSDEKLLGWWLEKVLPPERMRTLQGRLVFLPAHARPTPASVNVALDTIEEAFSANHRPRVRALVIADSDYMLDEQREKERKTLEGSGFSRQRWLVWDRVEIESYLLEPKVLVRAIREKLGSALEGQPLFLPTDGEIEAVVEAAIESSKTNARNRLLDLIHRSQKGLEASTSLERAESLLERDWSEEGRLALADAKAVVFPELRRQLQTRWQISLSDKDIIDAFEPSEVPLDVRTACEAIASFVLGSGPESARTTAR
ncbi:MAG: AAA family ATPase [Thermoanaerobaculia bacterium]|nr:AAA family ATPase [Thermoanaerobaculia bacterium]